MVVVPSVMIVVQRVGVRRRGRKKVMKNNIKSTKIQNIRSFKDVDIKFSDKINVFVGHNNAGKSTILKSIYLLQDKDALHPKDKRVFENEGKIIHVFQSLKPISNKNNNRIRFSFRDRINMGIEFLSGLPVSRFEPFPQKEPDNLIFPFFSKRNRKIVDYVGEEQSIDVKPTYENLSALINDIKDSGHIHNERFMEIVELLIGTSVTTFPSQNGATVGIRVGNNNKDSISIDSLGDGVPHILALLHRILCSENKIFLIEELENDLHPKAIKEILNLIIESSDSNQFFITTHSNIVVRKLSENDNKIFNVELSYENNVPTSSVTEIKNNPSDLRRVYLDLGYEMLDFGLWEGWLILEESSAESIIKKFLIPWFCPNLIDKLGTISARGYTNSENVLNAVYSTFLTIHLSPEYLNKAWVLLDGGKSETEKIKEFKNCFCNSDVPWFENNFLQLEKHDFELYYPERFKNNVDNALNESGENKKKMKKELLIEVIDWINEDEDAAKSEFEKSAKEVIDILKEIESQLL